jgi:uncharacterized protein YndB with AHSA1/START domain
MVDATPGCMTLTSWVATGARVLGDTTATALGAWVRYGRPPHHPDARLDRWMPSYEICERHAIEIAAPPEVTMAVARALRLEDSRIVRAIVRTRERMLRAPHVPSPDAGGFVASMQAMGWGVLTDEPRFVAMGAVTEPWTPSPVFRPLPPDALAAFSEPGHVKIIWTLEVEPTRDGSRFITQTRAVATDPGARARFRRYWALVSPGVVLIRHAILLSLKAEAERVLPGDEVITGPRAVLDHEIQIDVPPSKVWPWLVQMGCQRAGWYSWDVLDNAAVHSADHILPGLQRIAVGDVLPMRPHGDAGFQVIRVDPERALVLRSTTPSFEGTWAFVLQPRGDGTRLVTRYRATYDPTLRMTAFRWLMGAAHAVMERKQLRTIKHHAERFR